jgi:hypothetical protein
MNLGTMYMIATGNFLSSLNTCKSHMHLGKQATVRKRKHWSLSVAPLQHCRRRVIVEQSYNIERAQLGSTAPPSSVLFDCLCTSPESDDPHYAWRHIYKHGLCIVGPIIFKHHHRIRKPHDCARAGCRDTMPEIGKAPDVESRFKRPLPSS